MEKLNCEAAPLQERVGWVDVFRGIGALLVVLGHNKAFSLLGTLIFMFHMPLFFYLSGRLFRIQPDAGKYIAKKTQQLILPYVSFLAVCTVITLVHTVQFHRPIPPVLLDAILGGERLKGINRIFWFPACLYLVLVFAEFIYSKCKGWVVNVIAVLFLLLAYANAILWPKFYLPFSLNVCLYAFPVFVVGYQMKTWKLNIRLQSVLFLLGGAITGYFVVVNGSLLNITMRDHIYGIPILSFLLSLAFILMVEQISKMLVKINWISRGLSYIGVASMGIMYLHSYFPYLIRGIFSEEKFISAPLILAASFAGTALLDKNRFLRLMFLGQKESIFAALNKKEVKG